jgi:hypothetical protein
MCDSDTGEKRKALLQEHWGLKKVVSPQHKGSLNTEKSVKNLV